MNDWKKVVAHIATNIEDTFDHYKVQLQERLGMLQPVQMIPYLGHGTRERIFLRGRVLKDKGITSPLENDTLWVNLVNMYKRYQSDEIPNAVVRATFNGVEQVVNTDEEGYFYVELVPGVLPPQDHPWYDIDLELLDYPGIEKSDEIVKCTGQIIIPPETAQFGVISDIDDTVLQTNVLNLLAMARNTFFKNAHTRLPFEGVAAFYHALMRGDTGNRFNPIYYVSSSAWNLYDMLHDFFVVRGIPVGPMFLTDLGIDEETLITPSHKQHKYGIIQRLLDTHPKLPFILVGDNGQKDPEIYLEVVKNNPGRILTVYIRDVAPEKRDTSVATIMEEMRALGAEALSVPDTMAASLHARERGYLAPEEIPAVKEEVQQDKAAPTALEQALQPQTPPSENPVT